MKYHAGRVVEKGYFLDSASLEIQAMPKGGGWLPGGKEKSYFKIPPALMVIVAPLLGLVYVVMFPIACGVSLVYLLARAVARPGKKPAIPRVWLYK